MLPLWALQLAAPTILGGIQGLMNKGAGGGSGGYDILRDNPSPWDYGIQEARAKGAMNDLSRYQSGQLPEGMQIMLDNIKRNQMLQNRIGTFGREGQAGGSLMDAAVSAGSMTGIGPKATNARVNTALQDWQNRDQQIQQFIDNTGYNSMQQSGQNAYSQLGAIPRSNELGFGGSAQSVNIPGRPPIDFGMGGIDWSQMFKGSTPMEKATGYGQYGGMQTDTGPMSFLNMGAANRAQPFVPPTNANNSINWNAVQDWYR
jgi:hypothetical protein